MNPMVVHYGANFPTTEVMVGLFLCLVAVILFFFVALCFYKAKYTRGTLFALAFALVVYSSYSLWYNSNQKTKGKLPDNVQRVYDAMHDRLADKVEKDPELVQLINKMSDKQLAEFKSEALKKYAELPEYQVSIKDKKNRKIRPIEIEVLWQRMKTGDLSLAEFSQLPLKKKQALEKLANEEDKKIYINFLIRNNSL